ncbi:MAG TPA: hypothetical protein VIY53_06560 [Acidobacteriaceae bacterium]
MTDDSTASRVQIEARACLHAAQTVHYRSFGDAASRRQMLSNPNSPLLALVFTVSRNTNVANGDIAKELQPPQALEPHRARTGP